MPDKPMHEGGVMDRRLTKHERYIMKKYTRIKDTTLFLSIDHQEFTVEGADKENIKWFQKMLTVALARMIEKEAGHGRDI